MAANRRCGIAAQTGCGLTAGTTHFSGFPALKGLAARQSGFVESVYVVGNRAAAGQPECSADLRRRPAGRTGAQGHRGLPPTPPKRIHAKTLHIEKLKMQLAVLRRARFRPFTRRSSIAILSNLNLLIGALEQDAAAEDARTSTAEPDMTTDPKTSARTPAQAAGARAVASPSTARDRHP